MQRRPEVSRRQEDEESYKGVTEGRPRCHARPGASLRTSVTASCRGWQGKPAGGSGRGRGRSPSEAEEGTESRGNAVGEAREGESSIEDGKR